MHFPMACVDMSSLLAIIIFLSATFLFYLLRNKNGLLTNWPLVGMQLSILWNMSKLHDFFTTLLEVSNGAFLLEGPWLCKMSGVITTDPADVHYVMIKNFTNFTKGPEFNKIFDIFGDGIFNADGDLWKYQRQMAHSFIGHDRFRRFVIKSVHRKIEEGLIPVLDHAVEHGLVVDMQDLFARLTLDLICLFIMGHDPGCLSVQLEDVPFSKALDDMEEAIFIRHIVPERVCRLFRWLRIGWEGKMAKASKVIDQFIYGLIEQKKIEIRKGILSPTDASREDEDVNLLASYMAQKGESHQLNDKFLRDTLLNLVVAGQDTTGTTLSWLFWLLSTNPEVESKIEEEVKCIITSKDKQFQLYNMEIEDLDKLVYLHGALCETLRLYPSVPINHKAPVTADKLPSGYKVDPNVRILFPVYAMGRTKTIWGKDCMEFNPNRWITEKGKLKNVSSYKFFSFGAGPRICLGKEMSFIQIKAVVSRLIGKYQFQVVEGHPVVPNQKSMILHMKHGFKVKVIKKST